jgi:hypothetical protein
MGFLSWGRNKHCFPTIARDTFCPRVEVDNAGFNAWRSVEGLDPSCNVCYQRRKSMNQAAPVRKRMERPTIKINNKTTRIVSKIQQVGVFGLPANADLRTLFI